MYNPNIIIIKNTINSIILLQQNEQNLAANATNSLSKTISLAKVDAYSDAISLLESQMTEIY